MADSKTFDQILAGYSDGSKPYRRHMGRQAGAYAKRHELGRYAPQPPEPERPSAAPSQAMIREGYESMPEGNVQRGKGRVLK